ncbi:MAG: hypothetical protein R2856_35060 [Caldilineaceae bacterium]
MSTGWPRTKPRRRRVIAALEDAALSSPPNASWIACPTSFRADSVSVQIAGTLVLEPALPLADEPVSMLDVSIRRDSEPAGRSGRRSRGISILFITHDLNTIAALADRIAVMYLPHRGDRPGAADPQRRSTPYTQALLSVAPVPNPLCAPRTHHPAGETPRPRQPAHGLPLPPRRPLAAAECRSDGSGFGAGGDGHEVACVKILPRSE